MKRPCLFVPFLFFVCLIAISTFTIPASARGGFPRMVKKSPATHPPLHHNRTPTGEWLYPFWNPDLPIEERVADLLLRLTLEEKVAQMTDNADVPNNRAVPRLNITSYGLGTECLRGDVAAPGGPTTGFAQALGMAATWNRDLVHEIARATSTEVHARFNTLTKLGFHGEHSGITCWSPVINIFRDPRWGRGQETYGEDPYLTSELTRQYVVGLQNGSNLRYPEVTSTCKHFDAYDGPENNRFSFDAEVAKRDWYETFLPPFRACVEAGARSIMCSYNEINGIPACADKEMLTDILRNQWGFQGYIIGDCGAVKLMYDAHHYFDSAEAAAIGAVNAGVDAECECCGFGPAMPSLVNATNEGKFSVEKIDIANTRLWTDRFKLGLLDPPDLNPYSKLNESNILTPEHVALAERGATESIVLLKNAGNMLPLDIDRIGSICVIGPNANNTGNLQGDYAPVPPYTITPYMGIAERLNPLGKQTYYAQGCNLSCGGLDMDSVNAILKTCDVAVVVVGLSMEFETEGVDRDGIGLPGLQEDLVLAVHNSGVPTVVALVNAGALAISNVDASVPAILETWYGCQTAGWALANVLFGDYSPSGRLPTTWYFSENDVPDITNYTMIGRTYRYHSGPVLYPFGYGLSYTQFKYTNLQLSKSAVQVCSDLVVQISVTNIGPVVGDEVVQFYVSDMEAPVRVPIRQLQGFTKLMDMKPGETRQVKFVLTAEQMAVMRDPDLVLELVAGLRSVWIGGGQPNTDAAGQGATFQVVGPTTLLSAC